MLAWWGIQLRPDNSIITWQRVPSITNGNEKKVKLIKNEVDERTGGTAFARLRRQAGAGRDCRLQAIVDKIGAYLLPRFVRR